MKRFLLLIGFVLLFSATFNINNNTLQAQDLEALDGEPNIEFGSGYAVQNNELHYLISTGISGTSSNNLYVSAGLRYLRSRFFDRPANNMVVYEYSIGPVVSKTDNLAVVVAPRMGIITGMFSDNTNLLVGVEFLLIRRLNSNVNLFYKMRFGQERKEGRNEGMGGINIGVMF